MSEPPQRTNTYTAAPVSDRYRACLFDWLAAHAPLWNQLTYRRRQQYFAADGDVWAADYTDLYDDYAPILGTATCQQLARKNSEAWRSHFRLLETYHDDSDATVTEKPSPPGYWGTREEGSELHGLVRNDLYTLEWDDDTSTLEFGVGEVVEDRYDFESQERLTLEVQGDPHWKGADSRLELVYDEAADRVRVTHPVRLQPDQVREQRLDAFTHTLDAENTTHTAAIDVGANNTLAVVTDTGLTAVYCARPEFADCGFDAHSDVVGAWNLLQSAVGPMARPAALSAGRDRDASLGHEGAYWQWNGHEWTPAECGERSWPPDQPSVSEPASSQPG